MIKMNILCVGNLKEKYLTQAQEEYLKRLQKFATVKVKELPEKNFDLKTTIEQESKELVDNITADYVILMDIKGKEFSSESFAKEIEKISNISSSIDFIIGGSNGVNDKLKEKANLLLSFSPMTFPHQLARIMLLEQIYRAFSINNKMPYHK